MTTVSVLGSPKKFSIKRTLDAAKNFDVEKYVDNFLSSHSTKIPGKAVVQPEKSSTKQTHNDSKGKQKAVVQPQKSSTKQKPNDSKGKQKAVVQPQISSTKPKNNNSTGMQKTVVQPEKSFTKQKPNVSKDIQDVLESHNKYRKAHGVPLLKLDQEISKYSQQWANKLLKMNTDEKLKHSPQLAQLKYGENLFWHSFQTTTPTSAVSSWYNECVQFDYQYETGPKCRGTGHFTQVVWKNSQYLGVGIARGEAGIFVGCNYKLPGNYVGQYTTNVCRPTKTKL